MRAKFVNEKFSEKTDPIKDMRIGITGLWDYTFEEAVEEIWEIIKLITSKKIDYARRHEKTYTIMPLYLVKNACEELAFEPDEFTIKELVKAIKKNIDKAIQNKTFVLNNNIKYTNK